MEVLKMTGGRALSGVYTVGGAKNAVLPIMAATLMVRGDTVLKNVPDLTDVRSMGRLLMTLGAKVKKEKDIWIINTDRCGEQVLPEELMKKMRASNLIWGPLLHRFSKMELPLPGGCRIGGRPMDIHVSGMRRLGVKVEERGGKIASDGTNMAGNEICLDFPSVGATENLVMAAVKIPGSTVIRNAAKEPEVADLCRFLRKCGGKIRGIGSDVLRIEGVKELCATEHRVISDRIVGGTVLLAAMICGGDVTVSSDAPEDMNALVAKMEEAGAEAFREHGSVRLKSNGRFYGTDLRTMPFPGFPTDLQPQFMTAMTLAEGTSVLRESIFENRFTQSAELRKMGADITTDGRCAVIRGRKRLYGAEVEAFDLRCGAALVLGGLGAEGETVVKGTEYIDRGYEGIENIFASLGGNIKRIRC